MLARKLLEKLNEDGSVNNLPKSTVGIIVDSNELQLVILGMGGTQRHFHKAYVDQQLDGFTVEADGEGEDHDHVIDQGKVLPGGDDNHVHPDVKLVTDEE